MDEILLHKNLKVSAEREAPNFFDSNFDENELYQIGNMIPEDTQEKLN